MYGYSHGGCITYRAVEQGAPVDAFAVIEGFTDINLNYLNGLVYCGIDHSACTNNQTGYDPTGYSAAGSGAFGYKGLYYPDASSGGMLGQMQTYPGVMGYNWRSAHHFASRGDLWIRKFDSIPILILHGDIDAPYGSVPFNPVALDEPLEFALDIIGANEIFVGPNGFPFCNAPSTVPNQPNCIPTSETCITGTVGAPIVDPTTHEPLPGMPSSCPVNFTLVVPGNSNSCEMRRSLKRDGWGQRSQNQIRWPKSEFLLRIFCGRQQRCVPQYSCGRVPMPYRGARTGHARCYRTH
jgi:hypothetical protein